MSKFPKSSRLLNSREFKATFDHGLKIVSRDLVVVQYAREGNKPRLGMVITRKIGNAVVRNRFKRHMREIFRRNIDRLTAEGWGGYDFVVVARAKSPQVTQAQLEKSFFWCLHKARQLHGEAAS